MKKRRSGSSSPSSSGAGAEAGAGAGGTAASPRWRERWAVEKLWQLGRVTLSRAQGSVVDFDGDCIVNAANNLCLGGGGVDGAISSRGGVALDDARRALPLVARNTRVNTGDAKITIGGDLSAAFVIHAVGPDLRRAETEKEEKEGRQLLASAYSRSLTVASTHAVTIKSVAFSLISAGIFRGDLSMEDVLTVSLSAIAQWMLENADTTLIEDIVMVGFTDQEYATLRRAWDARPLPPVPCVSSRADTFLVGHSLPAATNNQCQPTDNPLPLKTERPGMSAFSGEAGEEMSAETAIKRYAALPRQLSRYMGEYSEKQIAANWAKKLKPTWGVLAPDRVEVAKAIYRAAEGGNETKLAKLVEPWYAHDVLNDYSCGIMTPLLAAATRGHTECMKVLLAQPAVNPNKGDRSSQRSPLFKAALNGHLAAVQLLCSLPDVDVNKTDISKKTPRSEACADYSSSDKEEKMAEIVAALDAKGAGLPS